MEALEAKKRSCERKIIFTVAAFLFFLVVTIMNYGKVQKQQIDYTEVEVMVTETGYKRTLGSGSRNPAIAKAPEVIVEYEGKEYELINVLDGEISRYRTACKLNTPVSVYLSQGQLYSNINGIKTTSSTGKTYFITLGVTAVLFMAAAMLIGAYVDIKKKMNEEKAV